MPKKRIHEDRAMTSAELNRRFSDNAASIDQELDEAISRINWKRRAKAEKSLI